MLFDRWSFGLQGFRACLENIMFFYQGSSSICILMEEAAVDRY